MRAVWRKIESGASGALAGAEAQTAEALGRALGAGVYAESLAVEGGALFALARRGSEKRLVVAWPQGKEPKAATHFAGERRRADLAGVAVALVDGQADAANAAFLRQTLPWLRPERIGGRPSFGFGDRLGLATPGHVRAVRGTPFFAVLAQQSIREMERTQRSPQTVMDDTLWGVFQAGWRGSFGADADHLKTPADADRCARAGFLFFTGDPGEHVDDSAGSAAAGALAGKFDSLPWDRLETSPADLKRAHVGRRVDLPAGQGFVLDEATLVRAAVKYGRAAAHTAGMYRHLVDRLGPGNFELEVSVDETESPTTPAEHLFVAEELRRLGVRWASLAPRFVGRFEKGVDYLGDLEDLGRTLEAHFAIAERFGGYKISLHSGSDKFSVYALAARYGPDRVHVKTAGTSYLEALRVLASEEPPLFREILDFARGRYETDKATYHVSASLAKVPAAEDLTDSELPGLLDQFDARQVLHVTFGSVLTAEGGKRFRSRLLDALGAHEEAYAEALRAHFGRHLAPLLGR